MASRVHTTALIQLLEDRADLTGCGDVLRIIADGMPEAVVFAVDAERRLTLWNVGAERLLGVRREDAIGRFCLEGVRRPECVVGCHLCEGHPAGPVTTLYRRGGEALSVRRYAWRYQKPDGGFAGGLEVLIPEDPAAVPTAVSETFHELVSVEPEMRRLFELVRRVARTTSAVLFVGEPGTSRARLARALHAESHRATEPFVALDSGEVSWNVARRGDDYVDELARQATGGTLYLHEVDDLDGPAQAFLSRVLGAIGDRPGAPRLVASARGWLGQAVREGRFRPDLAWRLQVVTLGVPALRDRQADIRVLAERRLRDLCASGPRPVEGFTDAAMAALERWPWPGNVRELENAVTHAYVVGDGPVVDVDQLPSELPREASDLPAALEEGLAERVAEALRAADGHVARAATLMGVSRSTFWRWRKQTGV